MSRAPWVAHFGLKRTPFGKSIPAKDLYARPAHQEAIARINFCILDNALGVSPVTSEQERRCPSEPAVSALDPTRHQIIYVSNPAFGTRGLYVTIVRALGDSPDISGPSSWSKPPTYSPPKLPNATAESC